MGSDTGRGETLRELAGERPVLVTGCAGFIGFHVCRALLGEGLRVTGVDNLSDYYAVQLKKDRLAQLESEAFNFQLLDIADEDALHRLFATGKPRLVIHLAAQAGVRYSLENPRAYERSNITGTLSVLECCRRNMPAHLVFASSSSVYGDSGKLPFSVNDPVGKPVSLYAATKQAAESMAQAYAHLYGIPTTGLRFFTVYGPWGRPDMAYYKFARAIAAGKSIDVFNGGDMRRDFTFIDDIVAGILAIACQPAVGGEAPYAIYNLGNSHPESLEDLVGIIESLLGSKAKRRDLGMQPGDVPATWADIELTRERFGFEPSTSLADGMQQFMAWFREYHVQGDQECAR